MLPIVILFGILVFASPGFARCMFWPDAATRANVMLVETDPDAKTLVQLIETAKGLISSNKVRSKSISSILQALVGLEQIVQDSIEQKYVCDSAQIKNLVLMHNLLMKYTSDGVYYMGDNANRRLNANIIAFQPSYAKVCLNQFAEEYNEIYLKQSQKMSTALDHLYDLLPRPKFRIMTDQTWEKMVLVAHYMDGHHVPTGKSEHIDRWRFVLAKLANLFENKGELRSTNPKTGASEVTVQQVKHFLSLVENTCSHYEQQPKAFNILDKTNRLVGSIAPFIYLMKHAGLKFKNLGVHATGMLVCRDMKLIDINDLAKRITEDVNVWE